MRCVGTRWWVIRRNVNTADSAPPANPPYPRCSVDDPPVRGTWPPESTRLRPTPARLHRRRSGGEYRPSFEWLFSRRCKRWSQIFEHGEASYVEGCQLQPLDIRGCCDEVITESNTGVTATISAHHFAGTTGDDLWPVLRERMKAAATLRDARLTACRRQPRRSTRR
jgi:hypothetical protein